MFILKKGYIMKFKKKLLAVVIASSFVLCACHESEDSQAPALPSTEFKNVIDRQGDPRYLFDYDSEDYQNLKYNALIDNGAWHGHLLPKDASGYGGFGGIMQVSQEYANFMSGESFDKLTLSDADTGEEFDLSTADANIYSMPGALVQVLTTDKVSVQMILRFVTDRTSLVETTITNLMDKNTSFALSWSGDLVQDYSSLGDVQSVESKYPEYNRRMATIENGLSIKFGEMKDTWTIRNDSDAEFLIKRSIDNVNVVDGRHFDASATQYIQGNTSSTFYTTYSNLHNNAEVVREKTKK